jgi:hypothetical protein
MAADYILELVLKIGDQETLSVLIAMVFESGRFRAQLPRSCRADCNIWQSWLKHNSEKATDCRAHSYARAISRLILSSLR